MSRFLPVLLFLGGCYGQPSAFDPSGETGAGQGEDCARRAWLEVNPSLSGPGPAVIRGRVPDHGELGMSVYVDGELTEYAHTLEGDTFEATTLGPPILHGQRVEAFVTTTCGDPELEVHLEAASIAPKACHLLEFDVAASPPDATGEVHVEVSWDPQAADYVAEVDRPQLIGFTSDQMCTGSGCDLTLDGSARTEVDPLAGLATLSYAPGLSRAYEVSFRYWCDNRSHDRKVLSGHTGGFDQPVADPAALAGATFASRGMDFRLVSPAIPLLEDTLHMSWLPMVRVDHIDPTSGEIGLVMAWTDPHASVATQKACTSTETLPLGVFADPHVTVGPVDLEVVTGLGTARLYDFEMVASFSEDGQWLGDVEFTGDYDMRDLAWEMGFQDTVELCAWSRDFFATPCVPCPDGELACMSAHVDQIFAERVSAPITISEDACGISDHDALWDDSADRIFAALPGSFTVDALDYDGLPLWTATLDAPVVELRIESGTPSHQVWVVVDEPDGSLGFRALSRVSGLETDRGAYSYPPPPDIMDYVVWTPGGLDLDLSGLGSGFSGGGGASCSIVSVALGTLPWFALLPPLLGLSLRRRPDEVAGR